VTNNANKPAWRRVFDALERPVAGPVERGVRTDVFNDALTFIFRTRRGVQRAVERRTRRALHVVNLPTATDIKRLSEQVASLHREVRAVRRELDRHSSTEPPSQAQSSARTRSRRSEG
jgi:hypothetical protein